MDRPDHQPAVNGTYPNLPMPGFYPVLTLQANLTVNRKSELGKFVVIVREPMDQLEVYRTHRGLERWETLRDGFDQTMADATKILDYLMGWRNYQEGQAAPD